MILTILLTMAGTIVLASIIEGLLHQFILHTAQKRFLRGVLYGAFHAHAIEHHPAYRGEHYHRPAPDTESKISLGWYTLPIVMAILSPLIWGLWTLFGAAAGITFMATLSMYYVVYEVLHWNMHFPRTDGKTRWFARIPPLKAYFDWFDKRHFVHHLADDRNFNVVLPFYDLATGRYTTEIERIPWAIRIRTRRNQRRSEEIRKRRAEAKP